MNPVVLHYSGAQRDQGGVLSVLRTLAGASRARLLVGVGREFHAVRRPPLHLWRGPALNEDHLGWRNGVSTARVAGRVFRWLDRRGHVFHAHSRAALMVALWLHFLGSRRVVVSVHCYGRQRWFYRWASILFGDRWFWLTPAMRAYYGGSGRGWAQCIPPPVPPPAGENVARGRRRRIEGQVHLGGAGLLVGWKQWELLLHALHELPAHERARVRFTHIGGTDGSAASSRYAAWLRQLTRDYGLEQQVVWRGAQPSSHALLTEVDALVVLSQNEPCSVSMLEALRVDVPVLAADSGGAVDVIAPGQHGWIFRSGSATALAQRLRELLRPEAWQQLAPSTATGRFSAAHVAAQWDAVYSRMCADGAKVV